MGLLAASELICEQAASTLFGKMLLLLGWGQSPPLLSMPSVLVHYQKTSDKQFFSQMIRTKASGQEVQTRRRDMDKRASWGGFKPRYHGPRTLQIIHAPTPSGVSLSAELKIAGRCGHLFESEGSLRLALALIERSS